MTCVSFALRDGSRRLVSFSFWLIALPAVLTASCSLDDADACDEHQVLVTRASGQEFRVCVCDEAHGYVIDSVAGHGCKACAKGTVAQNGMCTKVAETIDAGAPASDDAAMPDAAMSKPDEPAMPSGLGEMCTGNADCASFDATFCDSVMTHTCLVEKCATGENACPASWACCDFSALLAGLSICVPEENLTGGACPMGGKRVEP